MTVYMYVCLYVCMHDCMYLCMYVSMPGCNVCMSVLLFLYVCLYLYVCPSVSLPTLLSVSQSLWRYASLFICLSVSVFMCLCCMLADLHVAHYVHSVCMFVLYVCMHVCMDECLLASVYVCLCVCPSALCPFVSPPFCPCVYQSL